MKLLSPEINSKVHIIIKYSFCKHELLEERYEMKDDTQQFNIPELILEIIVSFLDINSHLGM